MRRRCLRVKSKRVRSFLEIYNAREMVVCRRNLAFMIVFIVVLLPFDCGQ